MKVVGFTLLVLIAGYAQAGGYACQATCSGFSNKVIDRALVEYRNSRDIGPFEARCNELTGAVLYDQTGTQDAIGCWQPDDFGPKMIYCVKTEIVHGSGYAVAPYEVGGQRIARSDARSSCILSLSSYVCEVPQKVETYRDEINCTAL